MMYRFDKNGRAWVAADTFLRALFLAVVVLVPALTNPSFGQDVCDGNIEVEKGEGPGPFLGVELWLYNIALAEAACGAPKISKAAIMRMVAEQAGCGPSTEMYQLLQDAAAEWEHRNLRALAEDSLPDQQLSDADVRHWADDTVDEIGGCDPLLDFHKGLQASLPPER